MQGNGYEEKQKQLQVLLSNLDNVCERATKNSLFSEWHNELLDQTKKLVNELNEIAKKEGKPTIDVDYSKYVFKPSELSIPDLVTSYENYKSAKNTYDDEVLPDYWEAMEAYDKGEITDEAYKIEADRVLGFYTALKNARLELMENIRTATIEDYQKKPKDEIDKFLADLEAYNAELKAYQKKYKEWTNEPDPEKAKQLADELTVMQEKLAPQRKDLVKRRGLIYNAKTLKDLQTQKNMIKEIIKDSTESKDKDFEEKREQYESKLHQTEELIYNIEKFKQAIMIKKIQPLEPAKRVITQFSLDIRYLSIEYQEREIKKAFGPNAKIDDYDITEISRSATLVYFEARLKVKTKTTRKPNPNPKPKPEPEQNRDYDFNAVDEPSFLGKKDKPIPPPPPPPKTEEHKYYNLEELIAKILYGYPPDDSIHYTKTDNFIYMNKDIKIVNFPKSHGVTLLDKPMKLAKTLVSAVVRGVSKLSANIANLNKTRRNTIEGLLKRIEELTPEEIEFLANNFTANRMTELSKVIPEVAMNALNNRIALYFNTKLDVVNTKIYEYYTDLINKFNRYTEILNKLQEGNLSQSEIAALNKEKEALDLELCKDIIGIEEQKAYASDLNKGGAMSFIENWKIRHNNSLGGRNISKKFSEDAIKPYNYTQIAENVRKGNGYLAAKDFLYGEKVKIAGTKTQHKLKNWLHKTRVGAYEFKPFVELADYSQDTYWQDVLSTIAIAASIQNMMYVNQLKSELAAAQQRIATLDQTIAVQQQEIAMLNQQIANYNQYINQVNQTIQANNQAIVDLKNICALYNSDPAKFVEKMKEFAMIETAKTHGLTEYAMQHTDAGRLGTTALKSSGSFYSAYDAQGHLFSKDICDKITNISNDVTLTAEQKAAQISNVLSGVNQNLSATVAAGKADILKGLAMPASGQWSFDAFSYAVNNIATYDSTFVPSVFDAFVNAAVKTNSLQVINNVLPVQVTSITQLQQLAITLPTVDLLPAIVALSTLVGKETTLAIAESYREPNKKHSQTNWREKTDELAESIKGVDIDIEKEAKRIFDEREAEWKKKGPIYRLTHKKQKPTMDQAYAEAMKNAASGRSL